MRNRNSSAPQANPYDPRSPGFAERTRETSTVLPSGTVVVEVGQPVARLKGEGKRIASPAASVETPPNLPSASPEQPSALRREPRAPDLKPGLGKR